MSNQDVTQYLSAALRRVRKTRRPIVSFRAAHEAGHAVVGTELTVCLDFVTIKEGRYERDGEVMDHYGLTVWFGGGNREPRDTIISLSGPIANTLLGYPPCLESNSYDLQGAAAMPMQDMRQAVDEAIELVQANLDKILVVACELDNCGTVQAERVWELVS